MQNKWIRRGLWALGALLVFWAVAWLAVPPIAKSQVEKIATEKLGRKVTLGAVDFKPWSLELTVTDFAIATADGKADQLRIKRLYANAELQSVLRMAPVVDAIQVDEPRGQLTYMGGGKYDIDDVIAKLALPADKSKSASEPPKFALYNIALSGGALDFTDKSVNKTHILRDLNLSVPFLSNLESKREVTVAPHLAFMLNGSTFDSSAQGTPFAQTHKTDATVSVKALDLAPYLAYWPASLPVRLESAVLQADLRIGFQQEGATKVSISGMVGADNISVVPASAQTPLASRSQGDATAAGVKAMPRLFAMDSLRVQLDDTQPLAKSIRLASVDLVGPRLSVARDRAGRTNLLQLQGDAPKNAVGHAASTQAGTEKPSEKPSDGAGWKIALGTLRVKDGVVGWSDGTTSPQAALAMRGLQLEAKSIAWPLNAPLSFTGSSQIEGSSLSFVGTATDKSASVTASLSALPLKLAAPYLTQFLEPGLTGNLSAEIGANWNAPDLSVNVAHLSLADVLLSERGGSKNTGLSVAHGAGFKKLEVTSAQIDLAKESASVGKLVLSGPYALVERGADGRWMFERWLKSKAAAAGTPVKTISDKKPAGAVANPWSIAINEIGIDSGKLAFRDAAQVRPVALDVSALSLNMKNLRQGGKPGLKDASLSPLTVSARLSSGQLEPGKLDFRGSLGLTPMAVKGQLLASRLPLHALEAYLANTLNIELLRADTSFKGQLSFAQLPAGPRIMVNGDVALEDFRANSLLASIPAITASTAATASPTVSASSLPVSEELLSWKALAVRGLQLSVVPGTATSVNVRETALSDFFARININDQGRINLQDILKSTSSATATSPRPTGALLPDSGVAPGRTSSITTTSTPPAGPAAVITMGPMSLINGRVLFSDHFIKPNYSANLSELNGKLSAFSSVAPGGVPQMADLELRGRAQSTASLEILGKLNPLAKPLALDIKGKVRDLELPPLSPYSVKYAGYGIERGKLSVDVAYLIKPDGQLTASNKIVLNQLQFGDKVEGAPASLPVKLAVALLADRNGVIDIDLPVSGSINDPKFSLGGVIFKVVVNLIVKAITSPFALLSSAFGGGGGEELSMVMFVPGSAVMVPEAAASLDKVAKALQERESLKLTVVGTSSLEAEREAYKRDRLQSLVRAEKRREAVLGGASAGNGTATAAITVSDAEYPALLKQVYKRADMPKPRNLIGLAKDLPQADMEALLLANIPATEDAMRDLALKRGVAVKEALAARNLPLDRLFLGAAKTVPSAPDWKPHADLNIAQ